MFVSPGKAQGSGSRRNLALQPAPLKDGLHHKGRAQLQAAAAMMWEEVGAPWLYLEKAAEVVELLLQSRAVTPHERSLLQQQRGLLAGAHQHLASSLQLWRTLDRTAAKLTAEAGQSAAHAAPAREPTVRRYSLTMHDMDAAVAAAAATAHAATEEEGGAAAKGVGGPLGPGAADELVQLMRPLSCCAQLSEASLRRLVEKATLRRLQRCAPRRDQMPTLTPWS